MGLIWNKIEIPLASGLDTKEDPRAGEPTKLDIARDIQFDEIGGVQTRLPFAAMSNQIFGGGTLSNCRRLAVVNGELCVFTSAAMYSWNAQLSKWVLRSTHLAVEVDETPRFTTTDNQLDPDRAELNGTVIYTWSVDVSGGGVATYVAAMDKTTGSVLMSPTLIASVFRPRLVALATKILLFLHDLANNLGVIAIDPASPAASIAGGQTSLLAGVSNLYYDVVRAGTQDLCVGVVRRVVTTSYTVFAISPALVITGSTKARVCDGPIAVSTIPDGTQTQVIRSNAGNLQGDLLTTSTLADVFTGQAIGISGTDQVAACHRSVQNSSAYRCYVFGTSSVTATGKAWGTASNWVDNLGNIGSPAVSIVLQGEVVSRAFDYNGSIHVWLAFGSSTVFASPSGFLVGTTLQNSYFLYRDDGFLCAKAVAGTGGGFAPNTGHLSGITAVSSTSFAWCATKRRRFDAGASTNSDFAAKTPVDLEFSFDSNNARRVATIGRTGYIAAGEILQYDGTRLVECGFHVFPWAVGAIESPGGSLTAGQVYAYKGTWRYQNGQGETERSTTATIGSITLTVGTRVDLTGPVALTHTHKTDVIPAAEYWRTAANPTVDSNFYLITSNDPSDLTNPNRYMPNDRATGSMSTIQDTIADTALISLESNPENGAVLESLAPPSAKIIVSNNTRLFLAGVSGRPDEVWYSRLRNEGEIASFNDSLTIPVPRIGGLITALAMNTETLTVFRETAIYALPGDGFNNLGQGTNYGPARLISSDVGAVSQESVALTPRGLVFKSSKGWYLLGPDWSLRYIGANVSDFDSETVRSVDVVETQHHVRVLTSGRMLVWDYLVGHWGEWTISDGVHSIIWNGTHVYLTSTGPKQQQSTYTSLTYGLDVETAWIKPAEQQGDVMVKLLAALGEYRSAHLLRWRVARDYQYDGAGNVVYFDDSVKAPSSTTVGSALQQKHAPSISRCQAFKVRLTAVAEATRASLITTALSPQLETSGTVWNSTWTVVDSFPGVMGNAVTMTVAVVPPDLVGELPQFLPFTFTAEEGSVEVLDHFTWSIELSKWREDVNNVGVLITGQVTMAELEAAIEAGSALIELDTPDASSTKTVDADAMIALEEVSDASFSGGTYGSPTGEALKLTGLAADVGVQRGIRRMSAGQAVP